MDDRYDTPRVLDNEFNAATLENDISFDSLPFVELCHRHYADEVDLIVGDGPRRIIARETLEGMLTDYLLPIHLIVEMEGVQVRVEARQIASDDSSDQQRSSWFVEFLAKNGARHTIAWKTMRTWIAGKVVAERLYDQFHEGPAIQYSDLELKHFGPDYLPDHL